MNDKMNHKDEDKDRDRPGEKAAVPLTGRHNLAMASWAFTCNHCQWVFPYSTIGDTPADSNAEQKPKLPAAGVECICPHCKVKGTYRRYELIYQKSTSDSAVTST